VRLNGKGCGSGFRPPLRCWPTGVEGGRWMMAGGRDGPWARWPWLWISSLVRTHSHPECPAPAPSAGLRDWSGWDLVLDSSNGDLNSAGSVLAARAEAGTYTPPDRDARPSGVCLIRLSQALAYHHPAGARSPRWQPEAQGRSRPAKPAPPSTLVLPFACSLPGDRLLFTPCGGFRSRSSYAWKSRLIRMT